MARISNAKMEYNDKILELLDQFEPKGRSTSNSFLAEKYGYNSSSWSSWKNKKAPMGEGPYSALSRLIPLVAQKEKVNMHAVYCLLCDRKHEEALFRIVKAFNGSISQVELI